MRCRPWMRVLSAFGVCCALLAVADTGGAAAHPARRPAAPADAAARDRPPVRAFDAMRRLPVVFDANEGQFDPRVRFVGRARGMTAFLAADGVVLSLSGSAARRPLRASNRPERVHDAAAADALAIRFVGAHAAPAVESAAPLPGRSHYFIGDEPAAWRTDVAQSSRVVYRELWPGVDLAWHGAARTLEYDVVVAAGADVSRAAFRFEGARSVALEPDGTLVLGTHSGVLRHSPPVAWQVVDGVRRDLPASFDLRAGGVVGLAVLGRDASAPLVVDPKLGYSTYLGGTTDDEGHAIAVDGSGDVYVAGWTNSTNFPVANALKPTYTPSTGNPPNDSFVWKIDADGSGLVYSTYLGGSGFDEAKEMALDSANAVYVAGYTGSTNFPTVTPIQAAHAGGSQDGYVLKLSASGASLAWSTYLGGSNTDIPHGVDVDSSGNCFVGGITYSGNFPVASARQSSFGGGTYDGFVTKINAAGTAFVYSTYHGGNNIDTVEAITVDPGGACFVCGFTGSGNFPTQGAFQSAYTPSSGNPPSDAFVSKFNSTGSALVYSTYLGGSGFDEAYSIAVDSAGSAFVCGDTSSPNFPLQSAYQTGLAGGAWDAFLTKLSPAGNQLVYSTFVGGSGREDGMFVGVETSGAAYLVGQTESADFPVLSAYQPTYGGGTGIFPDDAFVFKMKPDGSGPIYSTFLGGSGFDDCYGCAVDDTGAVYLTGITNSSNFPTTPDRQQGTYGGGYSDSYMVRLDPNAPDAPTNLTAVLGTAIRLTWTDASTGESGFEIERRRGVAAAFQTLTLTQQNVTVYDDTGLFPNVTYTYRVRSVNSEGASQWSNEAVLTTPGAVPIPPPPLAPNGLALRVVGNSEIDLTWTDRSGDELGFSIVRRAGGGLFEDAGAVPENVTAFDDPGRHPGWPYSYKVRAYATQGPSAFAGPADATPPATLVVALAKGSLTDSVKPLKDKVKVKGTLAFADATRTDVLDVAAQGVDLQVGSPDGAVALRVPPGDPGWKLKKTKATWKSPKGSATKAVVVVDAAKGTFSLTLSGIDLPVTPDAAVRLLCATGADGGGTASDWTVKKPGSLRYP